MTQTINSGPYISHLLKLSLECSSDLEALLSDLTKADSQTRAGFLSLAHSHHVVLRALNPLREYAQSRGNMEIAAWCDDALQCEQAAIVNALRFLADICQKLESAGIQITVMKSLDHWPDLGNDLDLYTSSDQQEVGCVMSQAVAAWPKGRTWGDRLAHKRNFGVQGLQKSVEIHHGRLGQTGEHIALARRFCARRVPQHINGYTFMTPAPEERIIAAALQRMYRHFYIRVCDIVNTHAILESGTLDFAQLREAADSGGIWPGVATYLRIVTEYVRSFRKDAYALPPEVLAASKFGMEEVFVRGIWLRIPVRRAAVLYCRQICHMAGHRDVHGVLRLSLLPPLASVARLSYMFTGNHSGIW